MTPFDDMFAEISTERAAIHEIEGGIDRETAERMAAASTLAVLHACEVRREVRRYHEEGGEAVKAFLVLVANHRGQPAADRLRADALAALKNK